MLNFSEFFNIQGWIWINLILTSEKWQNPFQYIWFFTDDIIGIQNGPNDEKQKPPQFHVFSCFYFFSVINAFLASQLSQKLQDEISDELSKVRFFYEFDLLTLVCQIDVHARLLILGVKVQPTWAYLDLQAY